MSLRERIDRLIRQTGSISVADYMTLCLHDRSGGYYATRPAIGATGDFSTSTSLTPLFARTIANWIIACWEGLGRPARYYLVELGPGASPILVEALGKLAQEGLASAAQVHLVEPSPVLRDAQASAIDALARWLDDGEATDRWSALAWHDDLARVPRDAPMLVVGNEVLDCLPARQFVRQETGWAERRIGLDGGDALVFGLQAAPLFVGPPEAPAGAIVERSPAQAALGAQIGHRVTAQGGAALLIDYGRAEPGYGDTFQAVSGHAKVDPLLRPGEVDLTVWADFPAVAEAARVEGAGTRLLTQGGFLERRGIGPLLGWYERVWNDGETWPAMRADLHRLTAPDQMGELFKALAIYNPADPVPPGFEDPA